MINLDELPAVDMDLLSKILKGSVHLPLTYRQRVAARIFTDAFGCDRDPWQALENAKGWLDRTYEEGRTSGIREERDRWEERIFKLFALGQGTLEYRGEVEA